MPHGHLYSPKKPNDMSRKCQQHTIHITHNKSSAIIRSIGTVYGLLLKKLWLTTQNWREYSWWQRLNDAELTHKNSRSNNNKSEGKNDIHSGFYYPQMIGAMCMVAALCSTCYWHCQFGRDSTGRRWWCQRRRRRQRLQRQWWWGWSTDVRLLLQKLLCNFHMHKMLCIIKSYIYLLRLNRWSMSGCMLLRRNEIGLWCGSNHTFRLVHIPFNEWHDMILCSHNSE